MADMERRRALKGAMPTTHLSLHHTEKCRVLPNRLEMLNRMQPHGIVAEIGAAFGDFSGEILSRCKPKELHLIDNWTGERYGSGLMKVRERFAGEIADGTLHLHHGLSTEKLPEFADSFFDWVYIDTNHSFDTTWNELGIANSKVKLGGRIAGHDFCTGNVVKPVPYGVVEAVTKFCKDCYWQFEYLTVESDGHFSFCLTRI